MVPLVLLGSLTDRRVGQALKDLFSQTWVSFLHICGSKLDLSGTAPDFLIYETDTLEHLPVDTGILICKETLRQPGVSLCHVEWPACYQNMIGILSSEDTAGATAVSADGAHYHHLRTIWQGQSHFVQHYQRQRCHLFAAHHPFPVWSGD